MFKKYTKKQNILGSCGFIDKGILCSFIMALKMWKHLKSFKKFDLKTCLLYCNGYNSYIFTLRLLGKVKWPRYIWLNCQIGKVTCWGPVYQQHHSNSWNSSLLQHHSWLLWMESNVWTDLLHRQHEEKTHCMCKFTFMARKFLQDLCKTFQ